MKSLLETLWNQNDVCLNTLTLFIQGVDLPENFLIAGSTPWDGELDLYGLGGNSAIMNLVLTGSGYSIEDSLFLYLYNNTQFSSTTLYIKGEGSEDGYFPYNESMNLFLERNTANELFLYISGSIQENINDNITLYLSSIVNISNNFNLVMPNVYDTKNKKLNLYVSGF